MAVESCPDSKSGMGTLAFGLSTRTRKKWKLADIIPVTCPAWERFTSESIPCKCKPVFITENQVKVTKTVSLIHYLLGVILEKMQGITQKAKQEVQNVGENIKTGVKRQRLGKCDIEKKNQGKKFSILRVL